jgi:hypothetical protein
VFYSILLCLLQQLLFLHGLALPLGFQLSQGSPTTVSAPVGLAPDYFLYSAISYVLVCQQLPAAVNLCLSPNPLFNPLFSCDQPIPCIKYLHSKTDSYQVLCKICSLDKNKRILLLCPSCHLRNEEPRTHFFPFENLYLLQGWECGSSGRVPA